MTVLFFATEKEAAPFRAMKQAKEVKLVITGIGEKAAEKAAEEWIQQGATRILNAGVCAALDEGLPRGSIFFISSVSNEEGEEIPLSPPQNNGKQLLSVKIPLHDPLRKEALKQHADLLDMEGFAISKVCQQHQIPCTLIKGITDFGEDCAKQEIQEHLHAVSEKIAQTLVQFLHSPSLLQRIHSFTKIEHILFSLPLLFAGAWLGGGDQIPSLKKLGLIALVGVGARTFGMALNRIFDRKIDAQNPRTQNRELPSGKLSVAQGWAVAAIGVLIYFIACFFLGNTVFKLSLLPLIPLALYSLLKRFTPLCHYGIGICLAAAPLGAYVAVSNQLHFSSEVLYLALFSFFWISGFDIIYALLDLDFDRKHGIHSIPAWLGKKGALGVAATTHLGAILALLPLIQDVFSGLAVLIASFAIFLAYLPIIPLPQRFFPLSAISGIAGALTVLL